MVQPLNQRTIKSAVKGARQYVQDEKIQISRRTITKFQYGDRWPDEYNSWVTSESRRNLYKDPEVFFRVMHSKPEWYAKKFIFKPVGAGLAPYITEAAIKAHKMIISQLREYVAAPNVSGSPNKSTGHYVSMIRLMINDDLINNVGQLNKINDNDQIKISNIAEYATRTEANAFHHAKVGGIFYYAASMLRKKYPMLAFRFSFVKPAGYAISIPTLAIGSSGVVAPKLQKPRGGTYNHRTGRRTSTYKAKYASDSTAANPKRVR
jgi:hypothetical protein